MDAPLVTEERPKDHIVLVVDKDNQFGSSLAAKIHTHATVVLVSEKKPESIPLIHIPYTKRVPEIPVGTYSHMFLFSEDQTEHELLLPLAEKANKDNAKFVYILPYWLYRPEVTERLASLCKYWVLVLVGDVFDMHTTTSHIGQILHQAKAHKPIALPDLGLETLRPVAFLDAVESLLRIGFGLEKDDICFIFSRHPFTALSIVHALQKVDPLLRIDFANRQSSYPSPLLPEGRFLLETEYPALKKIQETYQGVEARKGKKEEKFSPIVSKKTKGTNSWRLSIFSLVFGLFFFLALPLLWTVVVGELGSILLDNAKIQMEKGSFGKAQEYAHASSSLFKWAENGSSVMQWEAGLIGQKDAVRMVSLQLHSVEQLAQIITGISQAGENFQHAVSGNTLTPQATFTNGMISLKAALLTLQSMSYLPKNVKDEITPLQPLISLIAQTIDISPSLFGLDKPKTYLLLIQNNADLRPGGGAIEAYAVITVDKGKVGKMHFQNISDADSQLKGHVEPPFALRRYMAKQHWYLQDSNFSADNLKNAQTEAFFIQQELGIKVDGVIAMDMDFIKTLLKSVGGVHSKETNQTITADTIGTLLQSKTSSTSATTQEGEFLPHILTALQNEIQSGKVTYPTLGKFILDAFTQKHLMVAFPDVALQQLFTINNMSAALWDPRKTDLNTVNDFTGISEANIGQNQANAFVKRSITQDMLLSAAGTISGALTIHYENTGEDAYKNYLRVLLPAGAQITNISLNNTPQSRFPAIIDPKLYEAKSFKPVKGLEIEHAQEAGKEEYGFLVTIPAKSMLDVALLYGLSQKVNLAQTTSTFDELLFKQPGTEDDPYTFTMTYPNFLTVTNGPKDMKKSASKVTITKPFATDLDYKFTFSNQ